MESNLAESFENFDFSPGAYLKLARRIRAEFSGGLNPFHAAFLSTFNLEIASPYLTVESARCGIRLIPWFAPFGQIEQQALSPESPLYTDKQDAIIISSQLEEVAPQVVGRFLKLGKDELGQIANDTISRFETLLNQIRQRSDAAILIGNFAMPRFPAGGLADPGTSPGSPEFVVRLNRRIAEMVAEIPDAFVFDFARLVSDVGLRNWFDDKLAALARVPFGLEAQVAYSKLLAKWFNALRNPPCKCLVLDFDDTLWGGVVGEDGIGGIHLGQDFPGNVFVQFQNYLLGLKDRGILLAGASKNNEDDALKVFTDHPDSVLSIGDFSALEIHWEDKAGSIRRIAKSLGIGLDAIAFFDDSPVERDWVRSQLPEVTVIDVPPEPIHYREAVENSGAFDMVRVSSEDRQRADMVAQDRKRKASLNEGQTVEDFLRGLEMVVTVGFVDGSTLPRVSQLVAKTNQFNVTTRRHTAAELNKMINAGAVALWLRLSDRFGDQGLTGFALAVPDPTAEGCWRIDTFLLSCRILSRGIEAALLSCLVQRVKERDGRQIIGEYIPSGRNGSAADLFERHGFSKDPARPNFWNLSVGNRPPPTSDMYTLKLQSLE